MHEAIWTYWKLRGASTHGWKAGMLKSRDWSRSRDVSRPSFNGLGLNGCGLGLGLEACGLGLILEGPVSVSTLKKHWLSFFFSSVHLVQETLKCVIKRASARNCLIVYAVAHCLLHLVHIEEPRTAPACVSTLDPLSAPSLAVFRQRLKTFLFSRSYQDTIICLLLLLPFITTVWMSGHLWSLQ